MRCVRVQRPFETGEMNSDQQANAYRFGEWLVFPETLRIRSASCEHRLQPRAFAVLTRLLESPGQIVSIAALLDSGWKDRVVEPRVVHWNVNQIRKKLGDDPKAPRYIETIPKRGYRTIAPVDARPLYSAPFGASRNSNRFAPRSMAVLPFENLSPDPDNACFAAGIHEETLNQLAKIRDFPVIARVVMGRYATSHKSIEEIGRELNARAMMSGTVRFAGERVRITAHLVDVAEGAIPLFDRSIALNPLNPSLPDPAALSMALHERWDDARR